MLALGALRAEPRITGAFGTGAGLGWHVQDADVFAGRAYYNFSTLLCVPNALSQSGGYALGAQAGEAAIPQVITDAGFTRFRRAAETPFNLVYEVRP